MIGPIDPATIDPTYGYDREHLLAIEPPPEPTDFGAFWRATRAEASSIPLRLEVEPLPFANPRVELLEVRFDGWGGFRIGAWLARPRGRRASRGIVVGHGYGGRGERPEPIGELDEAVLYPCAPGFHLSARADVPDSSDRHVLHGIRSRETYLIRACVASLWAAMDALLDLCPEVSGNLHYAGASFGGGLGALALPWDERVAKAFLVVPTFGHHPLRLRCPCVGSGEAVRRHHSAHPEVERLLPYYDAAIAAARIRIPVLVAPALADPAVPPPGQFAVANALPVKRLVVMTGGHCVYPGQAAEEAALSVTSREWFGCEGPGPNPW